MTSDLEKDLRRLVKGDVLCDDLSRTLYSTAACAHSVKYGPTREYVLDLDCVMDDGSANGGDRWRGIEAELKSLLDSKRELIERSRPNVLKNSSGYHVFDPRFDMNRLLVGS